MKKNDSTNKLLKKSIEQINFPESNLNNYKKNLKYDEVSPRKSESKKKSFNFTGSMLESISF